MADRPFIELLLGEQCHSCGRVFDPSDLFDDYCEQCWDDDGVDIRAERSDERDEYTFQRDWNLN